MKQINLINKTRAFLAFITIFSILTIGIIKINALDAILQSPDILDVSSPLSNQKVKGTVNIVWKMYDDQQNIIPYTANIYDAQTCNVTNYGQLNSNPNGVSSQTQNNVLSWNTKTTLSNPNLPDGTYCLKICAAYKGANSYSACNGRNIVIINNNKLPSITSIPSKLNILETDSWSYRVQASDPDGDTLTYRFVVKPAFLNINSQTGLITSNNVDKNPGNNDTVKYNVMIAVDDNFSGSVTQQFEITVRKAQGTPAPTPPPSPTPSPSPAPVPPPAQVNDPTVVAFINPLKDDLFDEEIEIEWNITDENGIEKVIVQYSQDAENWFDITTITDPTINKFTWNVSGLPDGDYFLRITTTDNLGTETSKVSGKFTVKHQVDEPVESVPLIINFSPVNNSEIDESRPTISGEFVPSEGGEIDPSTFVIKVDDQDVSNQCTVDARAYSCTLESDLATGSHKVEVNIKDTNGQEANTEWNFSVLGEESPASFPQDQGQSNTLILVIIVVIIVVLLLTIPWVLYILWNRRNRRRESDGFDSSQEQNNAIDASYGYYLPPYNPVPAEPVVTESAKDEGQLESYINTFNDQFGNQGNPANSQMEQAEVKIKQPVEEARPVLPEESTGQSLAQNEPKISNAMKTEETRTDVTPEEYIQPKESEDLSKKPEPEVNSQNTPSEDDEFVEPKPVD